MIKTSLRALGCAEMGLMILMVSVAPAQSPANRVYDEELRVLLDQQSPTQRDVRLDAGGWLSLGYIDYDDGPAGRERTLRQYQLRGWFNMNVQDTHEFYVRGLLNYDDWNSSTNPAGRGDDYDEKLERAWYRLNVNRFFDGIPDGLTDLQFKVGRDFQTIGNSLVLSLPLDLLHGQMNLGDWQVRTFVGKTIFRSVNIDQSPLLNNRQDRVIGGVELAYERLSNHRPFVYFMGNWDHTDPAAPSPWQSYKYDSRYVGVGSRGVLGTDNLRYAAELVGEWGETYSNGVTSGRDLVEAYAVDVLVEYLFDRPMQPKLSLEYMFGSGDSDRSTSAVATAGGNTANTRDDAFNAFGFRDTGLALAPKISNLHICTGGVSLFPLESRPRFKRLETGGKVFFYTKHQSSGAISDISATNDAGWVGFEWDLFCNWRLASDLAWTARYGVFHPGSAYDGGDKSSRDFLYTGVVFSF